MLDQFKEYNVKAIFNLQEPGEHAHCGDGIVDMKIGFSYTPELLQAKGISVYFFSWQDMTNARVSDLLRNVKLMDMHIGKGEKVLVHCHAGQGRTALVIAAYLLYKNICTSAEDSIKYIKDRRPK
jgi:protein tyrosine phosphatase domain-containing protein 1